MKEFLATDQFKLYQLVWQRFMASQMEAAVFDTLSVEISALKTIRKYLFRACGSTHQIPGYLIIYEEAKDEDQKRRMRMCASRPGSRKGRRRNWSA